MEPKDNIPLMLLLFVVLLVGSFYATYQTQKWMVKQAIREIQTEQPTHHP